MRGEGGVAGEGRLYSWGKHTMTLTNTLLLGSNCSTTYINITATTDIPFA